MSVLTFLPSVYGNPRYSPPVGGGGDLLAMEEGIFELMRGHPDQGRPTMAYSTLLSLVARDHCRDMAERRYQSHTTPEGDGPNRRVRRAGYKLPSWWEEQEEPSSNFVESLQWAGDGVLLAAWTSWLTSTKHMIHLLGRESFYAEQTNVGVGYTFVEGSPMGYYYCVLSAPVET